MTVREHVQAADNAARQYAELAAHLLTHVGVADIEWVRQQHRLLSQEMEREIERAMKALRPDEPRADELRDALANLQQDAEDMASWVKAEKTALARLLPLDPVRYGEAHQQACIQCEQRRQRVFASSGHAQLVVGRIPEVLTQPEDAPPEAATRDRPNNAADAPALALDEEDVLILCGLAAREGNLLTHEQIEGVSTVSRGTISKRLRPLREAGLVNQTKGTKGGSAITPAGIGRLRKIDLSKRAQDVLKKSRNGEQLLKEIERAKLVR